MALSLDVSLFNGQVSITGAYHKIVRVEVVAEGAGAPRISGVVEVYKDKAASDAGAEPLERIGFAFSDAENALAGVDDLRAFLYSIVKTRPEFAGAVDV